MPDITYDVGRVSFIMKGAWNLATNYEKLDAVSYNGSLYIAKQDVPGGTAITNTTYWQLAAEKGDKGDTGGVDSVNGQQGDVWFPDSRQLISDGYTTDTDPFLMKGNDSDSDRFELAKKLGNTVAVNQLISTRTYSNGSTTDSLTYIRLRIRNASNSSQYYDFGNITATGFYSKIAVINFSADSCSIRHSGSQHDLPITTTGAVVTGHTYLFVANFNSVNPSVTDGVVIADMAFIDLTLWYGSNDRIPSDLLSHPENWGRYYAGSLDYAAGYLDSADGTILNSIGRQMWDEEWEEGTLDASGNPQSATGQIRSENFIPVSPNETCYFYIANTWMEVHFYDVNGNWIKRVATDASPFGVQTPPSNAAFCKFRTSGSYGGTYKNDITVSRYYSGESGYDQYYPFSVLAEVDTGSEVLRGVEGSRDEKLPSGAITRNRAVVDLSTLAWTWNGTYGVYVTNSLASVIKKPADNYTVPTLISEKYIPNSVNGASTVGNIITLQNNAVWVFATSGDVPSGLLEYPLATPTTEQGTAYNPLVATVKNGVLSWTNTKGIPVGHESHFFENLRKRVEDRLPDPPSADGTYRLTCTISGGVKTYSWEA